MLGGPTGIFVMVTCFPPAAVQEIAGEGAVQNPWRVTKIITTWCTPAEMLPAAAASAAEGPPPGPHWLTRSKYVSSNWRGRSWPTRLSLKAIYSRPKSVVELRKRFGVPADATRPRTPGEVSLYRLPDESNAKRRWTRLAVM